MRKRYEKGTIENALEFFRQDVFDLQEEMNNAADNMPEQLNGAHAEAAQLLQVALDFIDNTDVPSELRDVEVAWLEWKGKIFRPQKRDDVVNFLRAYLDQVPRSEEFKRLKTDLGHAIEALTNVFFPGMSGRRAA